MSSAKTDLFDNTLRANVAVFFSDYNKRIVPIGGTECIPPLSLHYPWSHYRLNGNVCLATTSLTSYQQLEAPRSGRGTGTHVAADRWRCWSTLPPDSPNGARPTSTIATSTGTVCRTWV
jgi:hypothetical protein